MPPTSDALPPDHPLPALLRRGARVLMAGPSGSGKTTLARAATATLAREGLSCRCLSADPGLPGFGPPGAACLGRWEDGEWRLEAIAALASLDAARFRLPLADGVLRLARRVPEGPLLVDMPGVMRGVAGAELLPALAAVAGLDTLLLLAHDDAPLTLEAECRALGLERQRLTPSPRARHPGRQQRTRRRTQVWNDWLREAGLHSFDLKALPIIGTPPRDQGPEAWCGRQVGLLDARGDTLTLGEIVALESGRLTVKAPAPTHPPVALVVRDARRREDSLLGTARPYAAEPAPSPEAAQPETLPLPPRAGERPVVHLDSATATLLNGTFGDPLLHLRLTHQQRSLLFDLGDPGRLPARLAHQVSDVFISHAHFDHIGGFPWLLRSRIGDFPPCRLFGPPGLIDHLACMLRGILWDRVGDRAPRFEVSELHGERLERASLVAGRPPAPLPPRDAPRGLLHQEPEFRVRAATLDHGTPVLAFSFEPDLQARVRQERVAAHGWAPGPWLGELKHRLLAGEATARITLPDGQSWRVDRLADALLLVRPGQRLVYATDLGDTPANRRRLTAFARGARVLFCEAPFLDGEREKARSTGHLTARACGEIAAAAGVARLVPFHFSRRHTGEAEEIHAEIARHFTPADTADGEPSNSEPAG
ncbi:MBL fold metallo-hydrolase [Halomonas sp. HK25]|uniref:MBL fold metallo-hydrolase n=1 Tax=Halomonas sp. HK25 TaxID=3394321 RepID=UPI0039FC634E